MRKGTYKYKFGGKEFQDELGLSWYDFSARNYDPALGRWMNIDPLAEVSRRWSPYTYAYNNPVYYIDPDGMMSWGHYGSGNSGGGFTLTTLSTTGEVLDVQTVSSLEGTGLEVGWNEGADGRDLGGNGSGGGLGGNLAGAGMTPGGGKNANGGGGCEGCPSIYDYKNKEVVTNQKDGMDYILYDNQWHQLPCEPTIDIDYRDALDSHEGMTYTKTREEYFIESYDISLIYKEGAKGAVGLDSTFGIVGVISNGLKRSPIGLPLMVLGGMDNANQAYKDLQKRMSDHDSHVDYIRNKN